MVKELVLKANRLCLREFESRPCRIFVLQKLPSLLLSRVAVIAQLGERQTEDLKVPRSIRGHGRFCVDEL